MHLDHPLGQFTAGVKDSVQLTTYCSHLSADDEHACACVYAEVPLCCNDQIIGPMGLIGASSVD